MTDQDNRPSPEDFLKAIREKETLEKRGQLKIFLGMAAGVGKTYAMLSEAQELLHDGVQVVIGIVETHGRQETAALTSNIATVPGKIISYRGIDFKELDVEEILALKPKVVLIDELAHTNVPGSKHTKRWQDVLEILEAGIDVYTTLNVQHIESLNDLVHAITDTSIRETIPDSIIEKASSIHLVDLTPDDLLQRLNEGKVYLGNQSKIAIQNFFQKDTLTALREVVLRYAADKVDSDLRHMMPTDERMVEWKPRDKFLVGVSSSPFSQKLIRITRRLAFNIDAPWIAAHVNTGASMSEKEAQSLEKNLAMARDLGAEVITVNDPDVASGIHRIAHQRGITQMIIGLQPSNPFFGFIKCSTIFDQLLKICPDIDIHVITKDKSTEEFKAKPFNWFEGESFFPYFLILIWITLISLINWYILPNVGYKATGSFFLVGILGLSLFFRKGPIFLASLIFAFVWTYFFAPPKGSLVLESFEDIALLALYLATAVTSGILVDRAREHREMLIKSEETSQGLYEIVRQIANTTSTEDTIKFLKEQLAKTIPGTFDFVIKDMENRIDLENLPQLEDEKEKNGALWAFENGTEAGWSTDTLPSAHNFYLPLKSFHEVVGLLIYTPTTTKKISLENKSFLYTVCQQFANYIERKFTEIKSKEHEHHLRLEDIQKEIFEQFLEAFQYPIAKARDAMESLKTRLGSNIHELASIETSCEIIAQILNNITAIIQINEGMLPLKKTQCNMDELIRECCDTLQIPVLDHTLKINIEPKLPLVPCDEYLIEILICNLILNAIKYSSKGSKIEINAKQETGYFILSVINCDIGISQAQIETIVQKFNQFSEDSSSGMGLGLSISKTIAEIHDGKLIAENNLTKGEMFTLYLPLQ